MLRDIRPRHAFAAAFGIGLVLASTAWSARVELVADNDTDLFVPGAATTDRNYSQGARIVWAGEPGTIPGWLDGIAPRLPGARLDGVSPDRSRFAFAIGQEIYTPDAISRAVPDADDRPYAGWLYAAAALETSTSGHQRTFEATVGVVGPAARADAAQSWWHRSLGIRAPRGWSHQLHNEPTLGVRLEDRWRWLHAGRRAELIPHAGAALGNVRTDAFAGGTVRVASALPADFGPARMLPGAATGERVHVELFARAEGRAIARDLFVDGNTFAPGPRATRIPLVGEAQLGAGIRVGRLGLRYQFSYTTQQLRERRDAHEYGSLAVSF